MSSAGPVAARKIEKEAPRERQPAKPGESVFGSLPKAGFLRRNKTPALSRSASKEGDEEHLDDAIDLVVRRKSSESLPSADPPTTKAASASYDDSSSNPFTSAADDVFLHIVQANGRRGSQISTLSYYAVPSAAYYANHRNSLSSFASSSGSPRAPPSSNGTTIGDMSTASMPLLPGGGRRDDESLRFSTAWNHHPNGSPSRQLDGSSSASISDTSSVHSYPPLPRTTGNGNAETLDGGKQWSNRSNDGHGYTMSYSGSASSSANRPIANPFGPLRKRLLRTVGWGKRISVEVQLLVELVDALENLIQFTFSPLPFEERTQQYGGATETDLLNEVFSLVAELCEVCPEAQRCLAAGLYGPITFSSKSTRPVFRHQVVYDSSAINWWPKRLAHDCRVLLEEVGFASSGATPRAQVSPGAESEKTGWDQIIAAVIKEEEGAAPAGEENAASSVARQQELLLEGKKRWAAYRESQQLSG